MSEMRQGQREAVDSLHKQQSRELREQTKTGKVTIPEASDRFAEGTNPNLSLKSSADSRADDEAQHSALVKKIKEDWLADDLRPATEARDHIIDVVQKKKAWLEDDERHAAEVKQIKTAWQADHEKNLVDLAGPIEEEIKAGTRAARVEKEIQQNPDGPLARLRDRVRKILSRNK